MYDIRQPFSLYLEWHERLMRTRGDDARVLLGNGRIRMVNLLIHQKRTLPSLDGRMEDAQCR